MNAARVLVLGCPGAGKTTLARTLAAATGLPLRHLDDEHWGPGWARPSEVEWQLRQEELTAEPEWIMEGNYLPTVPLRAARAELAIVVDVPAALCLVRAVRRAWRIRRGHVDALPAAVKAEALAGHRVSATCDFPGLLRKIASFRRRDLRVVVTEAGRHGATVVLAAHPARARTARAWCARYDLAVEVVPLAEAGSALVPLCRVTHHPRAQGGTE